MGNSLCGPPIYPDTDVHLPNFGLVPDGNMATIIEAATSVYDQNNFDVTNPKNWTNAKEQSDAQQWKRLISRENRNWYATSGRSEHDWFNALRNFLKANSDWSAWRNAQGLHGNPLLAKSWTHSLFDPIHWRIYWNETTGQWHDKGGYNGDGWVDGSQKLYNDNIDAIYSELRDYYGNSGKNPSNDWQNKNFGWAVPGNWSKQGYDAPTDITYKDPPPNIEGFGITQFLEWLTGLNYYQLFCYEYSLVLFVTLISIAWTDFYPFFVEVGLINPSG